MFRFTIRDVLWLTTIVMACQGKAYADFSGPSVATIAVSPDGNLIARIVRNTSTNDNETYDVVYFEYDRTTDRYERVSRFELSGRSGQMMFVSDAGDLVLINLSEKEAIRLYSKDGTNRRSWDMNEFLSRSEMQACAKTASTTQWFDDGKFVGRDFLFDGPSRTIKALKGSFTIMRGADRKVSFFRKLNAKTREIEKGQ